jgi:hypothetical protein
MQKKLRRTFVLPGGSESGITLKICMHISKQNVSMFQILSKKAMSMKRILNNNKDVSNRPIMNQIPQCLQMFLWTVCMSIS